ncbi:MAG: CheR family methyltransferase, partial [Anaerolineae bacterium]
MRTLTDPEFNRLRHVMQTQTGLEFPAPRRPDLEAAAALAMRSLSVTATDDLFTALNDVLRGPTVLDLLVRQLTVGETHFFRNRPQFAALESVILPELITRQQSRRRLRLWSAGCASGEEAYSLAILVRRLLPDLPNWDVLILAT